MKRKTNFNLIQFLQKVFEKLKFVNITKGFIGKKLEKNFRKLISLFGVLCIRHGIRDIVDHIIDVNNYLHIFLIILLGIFILLLDDGRLKEIV